MSRYIFLDTETTGLSPERGDRVVEIGCVEMIDRKLTDRTFHAYLNPERDMPIESFNVHGLSNEFLSDKPLFKDRMREFTDFIQGKDTEIVIHNKKFDELFVNNELRLAGNDYRLDSFVKDITCSLIMARKLHPGKKNSLDALAARLYVVNTRKGTHGALLDATLLSSVYLAMTRGQDGLELITKESRVSNPLDEVIDPRVVIYASHEDLEAHEEIVRKLRG